MEGPFTRLSFSPPTAGGEYVELEAWGGTPQAVVLTMSRADFCDWEKVRDMLIERLGEDRFPPGGTVTLAEMCATWREMAMKQLFELDHKN